MGLSCSLGFNLVQNTTLIPKKMGRWVKCK